MIRPDPMTSDQVIEQITQLSAEKEQLTHTLKQLESRVERVEHAIKENEQLREKVSTQSLLVHSQMIHEFSEKEKHHTEIRMKILERALESLNPPKK